MSAVAFDFDGLLMDTESSLLASWQYEWRQHGLELDLSTFWVDHGGDVTHERYLRLAEAVGPSFDHAASHARRVAHRNLLNRELGLCPGMGGWLRQARAARLRLAVASSSPGDWVRPLLSAAGELHHFEVFAFGDEVGHPKPAPDVYQLAVDRLGAAAGQVVAVEDSAHGVAAAKAAGLRCVAIPHAHSDPARFGAADLVLRSAADLPLTEVLALLGG